MTLACLHEDMDITERTQSLMKFQTGNAQVLITTDLFSHGIDVQQIWMVVNYDLFPDRHKINFYVR